MITDENGIIQPRAVEQLTNDALRDWIERRLLGKDFEVPGGTTSDDGRFLVIEQLAGAVSMTAKDTLQQQLVRILIDFVEDSSAWSPETAEELFRAIEVLLANSDYRDETLAALINLTEDRGLPEQIRLLAVQTLVGFRLCKEPAFWREQYRALGPKSAAAVFEGLSLWDAAAVFQWLREVDPAPELESAIRLQIPMLIEDHRPHVILGLAKQFNPELHKDTREALIAALAANGVQDVTSDVAVRGIARTLVEGPKKKTFTLPKRLLQKVS